VSIERQKLFDLISQLPERKLRQIIKLIEAILAGQAATVRPRRNGAAQGILPSKADARAKKGARRQFRTAGRNVSQRRSKNGKPQLPKLPRGLRWPRKKYITQHRKHGTTIVQFLQDEWRHLIDAGYDELRWLRAKDLSATHGITAFERPHPTTRARERLPPELHFLTEKEVTDRKIAGGLADAMRADPRIASTLAGRIRRGIEISVG
jgi:hypothetical protein